ncbi:MAG: HAMP domain-containing sensor histidine kinase [Arcobacteraceae bacterium]|nr:HAMP domain-containing sensor histidine kinase [Arcobacteraceae bacterium]
MSVFVLKNYTIVSNQLVTLEDEKIDAIVTTLEPIIAINLSLDLKINYIDSITKVMQTHQEIVGIELVDNQKHTIYKILKKDIDIKNTKLYQIGLEDEILKTSIGSMKVYYTFSSIYTKLLNGFLQFLAIMFVFFVFTLIISSLLIKMNLKPLQRLKENMLDYTLNDEKVFKKIDALNEVAIINNTAVDMLYRIEKEVNARILYEKQIMQKNRLASMGEMLDNIAHQWRQPLMKINGILLNIDRAIELDKLDKEYLTKKINEVSDTTYFMSQTIKTFRDFLNPHKEKKEFELVESIQRSLQFFQTSFLNVDVIFEPDKKYILNGIENEFIQVLISIFSNALAVFIQREVQMPFIQINISDEESFILVSIEDNGGGIDETIVEQIFDPYFTTNYKSGGSGMGLYICKMIMTNSFNGNISVENSQFGAKFTLKVTKKGI